MGKFLIPLLLMVTSVSAQSVKRFGVVDIDAEGITEADKESILTLLRDRFAREPNFSIVRADEISQTLVEKNKLSGQVEKLKIEHQNRLADLRNQFDAAQKYYQASQFEEAISVLEAAWSSFKTASLAMDTSLPAEVLKLTAACEFFIGNEAKAKNSFSTLLDLDSEAMLSAQKFPPALQEIFNRVKSEKRFERKIWAVESSVRGIRANLLGYPIEFQEGDKIAFKLPLEHPALSDQVLVVEKEGYVPLLISLKSLPVALSWQTIRDRRAATKGLFSPIGSMTPTPELKQIVSKLNLALTFLSNISRDGAGKWVVKAQLLEEPTGRTSPIAIRNNATLRTALSESVNELLASVSADGTLVQEVAKNRGLEKTRGHPRSDAVEPTPFYKTWWFWTLVGVGTAGAGAGAYLLLKPSSGLQFQVVGPN